MNTKKLVRVLNEMNWSFGRGDINSVTLNLNESNPDKDEWYGFAHRKFPGGIEPDQRMFKVVGGICTFLSHKRKLLSLRTWLRAVLRQ